MSLASVLTTSATAAPHELASPSSFEQPPDAYSKSFEELLPIMSRLPRDEDEAAEELEGSEYIQPQPGFVLPGTLPYAKVHRGINYTHARLPRADDAARHLWTALHGLRPLTTDYAGDFQGPSGGRQRKAPHPVTRGASLADCPFATSQSPASHTALDLIRRVFNWSSLRLPEETSASFYGVIFRSKRARGSESTNLYSADRLAHEEAVNAGGLLMYFYGAPDPKTGTNIATCIWTSRADAIAASALPLHAKAAVHARKAYESYELSRYRVIKIAGETGLHIEPWDEDD